MKKEILINHTQEETRIVLLEDGKMVEFFIDRSSISEGGLKKIIGNVYLGKVVNIVPNLQSAFVDIGLKKNAYLPLDETLPVDGKRTIQERLKKGQEVIVQVVKEPISTKGAKVSERISLPGRYLVYMPLERKKIFLSRQIREKKERERLKKIVQELPLLNGGLIIRTEAEGAEKDSLLTDSEYLKHLWDDIQIKRKGTNAPLLLHEEVGLVYQVLRDLFSEEVAVVLIDSLPFYKDLLNYVQIISPQLKSRVQYYSAKTPIFTAYKLEEEIKRLYQPKVRLSSGGYLIIQETESLCAIDVNTGKFAGKDLPGGVNSMEDTAFQTNLEAAKEIAREIRLRNIGGIIVIDFISLRKGGNRHKVYQTLVEALKNDKAKIEVLPFNRFGLIELTRERKRESTLNLLTEECSECFGSGRIISQETLYLRIKKELNEFKNTFIGSKLRLRVHPDLVKYLQAHREELKNIVGGEIELISDYSLKHDEYQIILH
ncbi:MAG TPA: Rne/Rng family ribonuclease [Elusimicrobia bacterium]|jgi:ribonuclease G|nr:Rne/Rng family ribonuclease [Elusimicrobiota bacterium]